MAKQDNALADAAAGFDDELAAYTRLGDLFLKTPLSSVKHLERANATLAEIAACEERLHRRLVASQHGRELRQITTHSATTSSMPMAWRLLTWAAVRASTTAWRSAQVSCGLIAGNRPSTVSTASRSCAP